MKGSVSTWYYSDQGKRNHERIFGSKSNNSPVSLQHRAEGEVLVPGNEMVCAESMPVCESGRMQSAQDDVWGDMTNKINNYTEYEADKERLRRMIGMADPLAAATTDAGQEEIDSLLAGVEEYELLLLLTGEWKHDRLGV